MAKVKITGDTKDAQRKIQQLRKEVDKLDKEAKKPKKVNVQGGKGIGGIGAKGGIGGALSVAGGNIISMVMKELLKYIPAVTRLSSGILSEFLGLKELEKAVTTVTPKVRNLVSAIEAFGDPQSLALERADRLDALDDEKRSHNSKSNAEEFGYSESFANVAGVQAGQIVERIQSLMDMATSGNISEMDKAWKQLQGFGLTWDEVEKGSTWNVLEKMIRAYHAAGLDGMNELEPAMQQIVGKRAMSAIRKVGSGSQWVKDAKFLKRRFTEIVKDENGSLDETAKSELIRSEAKIYGYTVPEEGRHYITDAAKTQLTEEELKTGMIGDTETAGKALWGLILELKNDIMPAFNEIKNYSWSDFVKSWFGSGEAKVENAKIDVENGEITTIPKDEKSTAKKVEDAFETNIDAFKVIRDYTDGYTVPVEPRDAIDKVTNKVKEVKDKAIEDKKEKLTSALEKLTAAINKNKDATANLNSYLSLNTTVTDNSGYFA